MKCAAAKIVPQLLNFEEKQSHMNIAQKMLTTFNEHPDLPDHPNGKRFATIEEIKEKSKQKLSGTPDKPVL